MVKIMFGFFVAAVLMFIPLSVLSAEAPKLRFIASIYSDGKGEALNMPEGVACNNKSLVIVADTGRDRLLRYSFHDGVLQGGEEIPIQGLSDPVRVQVNSKGEIFVLDARQRRIVSISPDGAMTGFVTPRGIPAPADFIPGSFKIDADDAMYILDIWSARVLILNPAGDFVRSLPFPDDYGFMSDVAVDARGTIYLIDSARSMVYSADKDAKVFGKFTNSLKENMNFSANMSLDDKGALYLSDQNGSSIITVNRDGSFQARHLSQGWTDGFLHHPGQLCINGGGDLFIADRDNNRVEIFSVIQ